MPPSSCPSSNVLRVLLFLLPELTIPPLPNECLYMIVGYLRGNLAALRTLLYVNRFFFKAALPVLLRTLPVRLLDHRRFNSI